MHELGGSVVVKKGGPLLLSTSGRTSSTIASYSFEEWLPSGSSTETMLQQRKHMTPCLYTDLETLQADVLKKNGHIPGK